MTLQQPQPKVSDTADPGEWLANQASRHHLRYDRCMRTTLSLDDDVAAALERVRTARQENWKTVVNDVLRKGLEQIDQPSPTPRRFVTKTVDLGGCLFPNIDNVWDVIAEAEGEDHH